MTQSKIPVLGDQCHSLQVYESTPDSYSRLGPQQPPPKGYNTTTRRRPHDLKGCSFVVFSIPRKLRGIMSSRLVWVGHLKHPKKQWRRHRRHKAT